MLGDLADQRLAVALGHVVARLDPLVGGDEGVERRPRPCSRRSRAVAASAAAASTSPVSAAFRGWSGSTKSLPYMRPVCRLVTGSRNTVAEVSYRPAVTGWPRWHTTTTTTPHSAASEHGPRPRRRREPVADASVRIARVPATPPPSASCRPPSGATRMPPRSPPRSWSSSRPRAFAQRLARRSLATPPSARHVLLVACAGDQVVGFAAVGPSDDADADDAQGELLGPRRAPARPAGRGTAHACSTPPSTPCAGGGSRG